jgi:hypothetical protein
MTADAFALSAARGRPCSAATVGLGTSTAIGFQIQLEKESNT